MPTAKQTAQQPAATTPTPAAPRTRKKAAAPAPADETPKPSTDRPVVYPVVRAEVCMGSNALTEKHAEVILWWTTEQQFQSMGMAQNEGMEAGAFAFKDNYMLTDEEGNKIRCLNNLDNRPFDEKWSRGLAHSLLTFGWAGSITVGGEAEYVYGKPNMRGTANSPVPWIAPDGKTYNVGDLVKMPAGTINGSSICLSLTARVESGQHSLVGLKLANQMYHAATTVHGVAEKDFLEDADGNAATYPHWDRYLAANADKHSWGTDSFGNPMLPGPVLETILVVGLSEDQRVLRTVDEVKPRSPLDLFYTSPIFQAERDRPRKREEMSRMMAAATDLFWQRSGRQGYRTNGELMDMVMAHPRLIKCVEHLFTLNDDGKAEGGKAKPGKLISVLGLSAGRSACLMYLMGSSTSDGDEYRNGRPSPKERGLDWTLWDTAKEFWRQLAGVKLNTKSEWVKDDDDGFGPVRQALILKEAIAEGHAVDLTGGLAAKSKLCVLARAWAVWVVEGRQFTELDLAPGGCLHLRYTPASEDVVDGRVVDVPAALVEDAADFGGIDVPGKEEQDGTQAPVVDLEASKEEARKARASS